LPVPKKRETVKVKVESVLPMPDPEDVAAVVEAPEAIAKPCGRSHSRATAPRFSSTSTSRTTPRTPSQSQRLRQSPRLSPWLTSRRLP
jgi:hypothetical protein